MTDNQGVNREYKDRLFKFIFGNPEKKPWTLTLYNAMSDSNYSNPDDLHLNTIEDAVFMGMKNDVSFIVGNAINFYEHQSICDENMPLRFLIYSGMGYERYAEESKDFHKYSAKRQMIPRPKCVCFYNGLKDQPERRVLKLSDSFMDRPGEKGDIEVEVLMININYGHNKELLEKCKPLKEYAWFVAQVRSCFNSGASLEDAIIAAIDDMPDDFEIKPFLLLNKAEVTRMYVTEYDHDKALAEMLEEGREEGREEGIEEGIEKGEIRMLVGLLKDGLITLEKAAERVNMTPFELKERAIELGESWYL